jgi:DASS family divalent anion:Na+ symporter
MALGSAAVEVQLQPEKSRTRRLINTIGGVAGTLAGIALAFHHPPQGLTVAAMRAAGILVWAVSFWVFDIMPEYVTALLMCTFWAVTKTVPFQTAFSNFSDANWWIIVGAFGLGVAATKSGLLRRSALFILNLFPATFKGQTLGLLGAGTVLSPFIPSASARAAIASPLALAISDVMKYDRKSPGATGMFGAMWAGFCVIGTPIFLSGTFINFATMGQFPKAYHVTWMWWFVYSLPWAIVVFLGLTLAIWFLYHPSQAAPLPQQAVSGELDRLGSMSRDEKVTFAVMSLTLAMWITESLHKVPSGAVAIFALCVLLALNVLSREDFRRGIDWAAVIYIGCLINMGTVCQTLKIDLWLGRALEPVVSNFVSRPCLFVVALSLAVYLARLVIVSITSAAIIFTVVLSPLVLAHGMHPWIVAFVSVACANIWFFFYLNAWFVLAFYGTGGHMVEHRKLVKLSFAYAAIAIIGFLVSVPYWRLLGLIPR